MMDKPGIKTTELWLSIAALAFIAALVITDNASATEAAAIAMPVVGYGLSRGLAKGSRTI